MQLIAVYFCWEKRPLTAQEIYQKYNTMEGTVSIYLWSSSVKNAFLSWWAVFSLSCSDCLPALKSGSKLIVTWADWLVDSFSCSDCLPALKSGSKLIVTWADWLVDSFSCSDCLAALKSGSKLIVTWADWPTVSPAAAVWPP
jgi:hypothetical protein